MVQVPMPVIKNREFDEILPVQNQGRYDLYTTKVLSRMCLIMTHHLLNKVILYNNRYWDGRDLNTWRFTKPTYT